MEKEMKNSAGDSIKLSLDIFLHGQDVADLAMQIGKWMDVGEDILNDILVSGIYHDVGKNFLSPALLNKPDKFTAAEYEEVKKHAYLGYEFMKSHTLLTRYAEYVLYHHEDYNGTGYFGLKGADINRVSQILRVADYYVAMRENRSYRGACSSQEIFCTMDNDKGKFAPGVFAAFLGVMGRKVTGENCGGAA